MKNLIAIGIAVLVIFGLMFLARPKAQAPTQNDLQLGTLGAPQATSTITTTEIKKNMKAVFTTNKGSFTIALSPEVTPNTVKNFVTLAQQGFYNGTKFHRVIGGFMVQGGDPLSKDDTQAARWGTGGPGYTFADEITPTNKNSIGTISMANAGPNTNGSQFFINVANNNFLDTKHTVFGTVTEGMEIVNMISKIKTGAQDKPVEPVIVTSIVIQ